MPDQDKSFAPPAKTGPKREDRDAKERRGKAAPDQDDRLDEGLKETFPASDPVSTHHIS